MLSFTKAVLIVLSLKIDLSQRKTILMVQFVKRGEVEIKGKAE